MKMMNGRYPVMFINRDCLLLPLQLTWQAQPFNDRHFNKIAPLGLVALLLDQATRSCLFDPALSAIRAFSSM